MPVRSTVADPPTGVRMTEETLGDATYVGLVKSDSDRDEPIGEKATTYEGYDIQPGGYESKAEMTCLLPDLRSFLRTVLAQAEALHSHRERHACSSGEVWCAQ